MQYAENTQVPVEKSRAEIEKILTKYGAGKFMYGWDEENAVIAFKINGKNVRFVVPLPYQDQFKETPTGRARKGTQVEQAYQQAVRQKWRALSLSVKAKLEAVESGIATFEEEFLPYIVLPNGKTVAQDIIPAIDEMYRTGKSVPLLTM